MRSTNPSTSFCIQVIEENRDVLTDYKNKLQVDDKNQQGQAGFDFFVIIFSLM